MNLSRLLLALVMFCVGCTCVLASHAVQSNKSTCSDLTGINKEVFALLDLNHPGLYDVKAAYERGDIETAAKELLKYYRTRTGIKNIDIDLNNIKLTDSDRRMADDALNHVFFAHNGYDSYNYGKDINWRYWPVKDNELRWQLHRHKWFTPMGKAFRVTDDEKYAKEWTAEYVDWIRKNPCVDVSMQQFELEGDTPDDALVENARFAWRPLEVSHRLQDQISQFTLFITSKHFTPAFLTQFLVNYRNHADYILHHYSKQGNHLLFEAQRMFYAGTFFPELKEAKIWQKSGIDILNREIEKQVYADGGQYELDLTYHLACINIFMRALEIATVNNVVGVIPDSYKKTVYNMIVFYYNTAYPDYTIPCFSDSHTGDKHAELRNYRSWLKVYPYDDYIRYLATEGKEGSVPKYLTRGFINTGFFIFRNGWDKGSTMMILKAGPKGEWHAQPDNGTFCLWFNGRDLFPDSGSFIYAGNSEVQKQRDWFRQSCVHNTMTLDNKNFETTLSKTLYWDDGSDTPTLVTENHSYAEMRHRRTVFFVEQKYFIVVDEALGPASGTVTLHYLLADGGVEANLKGGSVTSSYTTESNVYLQCVSPDRYEMKPEEGWYSTAYRKKTARPAFGYNFDKATDKPMRAVSLIYPEKEGKKIKFAAKIVSAGDDNLKVDISVNGMKRTLRWNLNK